MAIAVAPPPEQGQLVSVRSRQWIVTEVTPSTLHAHGLAHKGALVKVLGRGEISRAVKVTAHGFSRSAVAAIEAAGGSVVTLPSPYRTGRPPVKGNQFTNR